jgi:cation-transporting ATPase E
MNDGAQISKDIGDLVLLNNALTTLPKAFADGRLITQSIFATGKMYLIKNIYSTLLFLFVGYMAMPFPINPIQISWLTLGIVNLPAALIALRVIKPAPARDFRRDVLDYIVIGGVISAAAMTFVFAMAYILNGSNTQEARSTMMIFITFIGLVVAWNATGIDVFVRESIDRHRRIFNIGLALTAITIIVPYLFPSAFEFQPPALAEWVLVAVMFALTLVVMRLAFARRVADKLWALFR